MPTGTCRSPRHDWRRCTGDPGGAFTGPTGLEGVSLDATGSTGGGVLIISAFGSVYLFPGPTGPTGAPTVDGLPQIFWSGGPLATGDTYLQWGGSPTTNPNAATTVMGSDGSTVCMYVHLSSSAAPTAPSDGWNFNLLHNYNPVPAITVPITGVATGGSVCTPLAFSASDTFEVQLTSVGTSFSTTPFANVALSYQS